MMKYARNRIARALLTLFLIAVIVLSVFIAGNNLIAAEGDGNKNLGIALMVVGVIGFIGTMIAKNKDNK